MDLEALIAEGLTLDAMALRLGRSPATVRRQLRERGLQPAGSSITGTGAHARPKLPRAVRECSVHGPTLFAQRSDGAGWRCLKCRSAAVTRRRQRIKAILVAEAGGRCAVCSYDRYPGVLQFHHRDPADKRFSLSEAGLARSLERARHEARKCVLLCANCHVEVEAGITSIPYDVRVGPG
jgi:hypothetical protein